MALFKSMSITNAGQVLYAKAQAGKEIHFTKMQIGSGQIGSQNPATLNSLIDPKLDVPITSITANPELKSATIIGNITNSNVTEATYICELGLWANDPDIGEILYGYACCGMYGDYYAPASQGPFSWQYEIGAAIGNAANVTAELSQLQWDYGVMNSNTTFVVLSGGNQKEINKCIDAYLSDIENKNKIYPTTNSGNAYSVTVANLTSLTDGYPLKVKFNAASTGAITVNPNSLGAKDVVDYFGNKVNNVRKDLIANLIYDAANGNFQLLGKGGGGDATAAQLLLGKKATVDSGPIVGTLDLTNLVTGNIKSGVTINGVAGKASVVDTIDATATIADIVNGKSAYINGTKITGQATIESLGGKRFVTGVATPFLVGTNKRVAYITIPVLSFTPSWFCAYGTCTYNENQLGKYIAGMPVQCLYNANINWGQSLIFELGSGVFWDYEKIVFTGNIKVGASRDSDYISFNPVTWMAVE